MNRKPSIYQTLRICASATPTARAEHIDSLWYDWFCSDKALAKKGDALLAKLKQIMLSPRFDITKTYVFFKNNCPLNGSLYDEFRICDMKTGDVIYTITPKNGHAMKKNVAEVWGRENDFAEPLYSGDWAGVVDFFMTVQS